MARQELVLVVDDNEEDLASISALLRQDGYNVQTAVSGIKACQLLEAQRFDVVLTDLVMPGTTGFDVLRTARKADPEMIGIAMTSFGSLDSALDALRFGAYSYLLKPCEDGALRNAITRGLEKRRLTKELRQRNQELESLNRELDSRVQRAVVDLQALNHRMLTEMASLREVDELKSAFLSSVSHDLRSPVTTIKGYLSYLLDDGQSLTPEQRNCLQGAGKGVAQIEYLIGQLLDSARLSSGLVRLQLVSVSIRATLDECRALFEPQAQAAGVALEAACDDSAAQARFMADRGRVIQILSNLLGNALKFTPRGGKVALTARLDGGGVEFGVQDTGPGIPAEHLPRIFDRFYQVDRSPSATFRGLGLGLHIAKDLVSLHDGRIRVESEPGQGSRFFVTLPLVGPAVRKN